MIDVFGSTGFIGSRFCQLYPDDVLWHARDNYEPMADDVLYLISTVDNYNVFENAFLDVDTNLIVLLKVLENCKNKNLTFNFVSSWFVYGKTDELPATESSYCNPKGFYSITKRCAEQLLVSYCETFDIRYRILRLANVYGETDASVSPRKNALQHLMKEIIAGRDVKLYDGGKNIRDFIYVDDACRAIKLCLEKADVNDIINIGSGKPYQFLDLMQYTKDKVDSQSQFIDIKASAFHNVVQVKNMYLDTTKLKKLGFKQKFSIHQGLDRVIEQYQKERL